jgi:RNA polymerase sigma factor (sigma-70 family)
MPTNQPALFDSGPHPVQNFNTTHWSVVLLAGNVASSQSAAALEKLCRIYWPPLYAFVRRRGYSEHDAEDLTQEFFASLLRRNDFETVDPGKGRFRTFLLTSLAHFLANQWDRSQAAKRGGGQRVVSLDEITDDQWRSMEPQENLSPDKAFDARWALIVMKQALAELKREMAAQGKETEFEALKPFLTAQPGEGEYAAAGARLGQTSQTVAVAVHRMRQRYRECVRAEVAQTVSSPVELEQELRHLRAALS